MLHSFIVDVNLIYHRKTIIVFTVKKNLLLLFEIMFICFGVPVDRLCIHLLYSIDYHTTHTYF
jgi:hypothetical protein